MDEERILTFYLRAPLRDHAAAGQVNFVNKVVSAFASRGYTAEFRENSDLELATSAARPGLSMFHMDDPFHDRALTMRLAYFYPFWRIEKTGKRWDWTVARAQFEPDSINKTTAENFTRRTAKRLFGTEIADTGSTGGYLFMPLQGRLQEMRSFQSMSPLDMIRATLDAKPGTPVIATLHPKETYRPEDMAALDDIQARSFDFSVLKEDAEVLVRDCSCVVTQNSAVALNGYFHHKPVVLFGDIDFHHIASNVADLGVAKAFRAAAGPLPEFDKYLFWFLQKMSINAGRDNAESKILQTVRSHGWQI